MVSHNSCPNLTSAFGATCLQGVPAERDCATPYQGTSAQDSLGAMLPGTDSTPTIPSPPTTRQSSADTGRPMGRSSSTNQILDQLSPPDTASPPSTRDADQTGASSIAPQSVYNMSPAKTTHASSATSDAKVALRQSALTRSTSDYSASESTSSTTPYEFVSSQSSFSPTSAIDRSTSSASLASSFGSYFTGEEAVNGTRSSPPTSETVPSPAGATPALVSLIRRNGASGPNGGRTTRSKTSSVAPVGKPRRSSKLTEYVIFRVLSSPPALADLLLDWTANASASTTETTPLRTRMP